MTPVAGGPAVTTRPTRVAGVAGRVGDRHWLVIDRAWLREAGPVLILGLLGIGFSVAFAATGFTPVDARVYFDASPSDLYRSGVLGEPLFLYPPPLAQALVPLSALGWPVFLVVWQTMLFASLGVAARWWGVLAVVGGLALLPVLGLNHVLEDPILQVMIGNAQPLVAAAIILGLRWPAVWSVVLLTKILPGIGVLWFFARGEWRNLAIALGATTAIAAASFVLAPTAWLDFASFALTNVDTGSRVPVVAIPLALRLPAAAALIVWGARTDRRWTVPIACGIAAFALYEWAFVTIWLAALPLVDWSRVRARAGWRSG